MSKEKHTPRRAFSYVRFSSAQQAEGGSLSRQTALSQAYCERKGLTLDDSLTLHDLGVSAYRGDNVREGALAAFLEACRTGRVPRGSSLIVESLDHLSRDQIRPALQLFLGLQDFGITIVTLQPEREYLPDGADALQLIEPLIVFAWAHEESAMKAHRRRDGWKQARDKARQGGGPMMKTCPRWLEVTGDGFRVREEAAAAVRRIYAMALDGLGVHRITERLVQEGVPPIGTGGRWVKAYVYLILASPAAAGAYQPKRQEGTKVVPDGPPIPDFYPAVVTTEQWNAAQAALRGRGGDLDDQGRFREGGRPSRAAGRKGGEETNLFTGLLRSAPGGEPMHIVNALGRRPTDGGERKRYRYLCPTRETGVPADGLRIDYSTFEAAVLSLLRELRPEDVLGGSPANDRQKEENRLSGRLLDIDGRLERAKQRAKTAGDFDAFLDLIASLSAERQQVADQLAALQQEAAVRPDDGLREAKSLIDLLEQAAPEERADLRRRLKMRLQLLVREMRALTVPRGRDRLIALQLWFASGKRRRDYLIVHRPGGPGFAARQEATWECRSLSTVPKAGDLDLRKPEDAAKLEAGLSSLDLSAAEPEE
jgi:DNA invertase Pin-like site-specific DNA recombinase